MIVQNFIPLVIYNNVDRLPAKRTTWTMGKDHDRAVRRGEIVHTSGFHMVCPNSVTVPILAPGNQGERVKQILADQYI